ncbi:PLC-like phosphodiesterase [Purpureocillium lavendulum]|uniref:PLC-like phosphodiesterase n=1 Tax=Purpureocillium lavendulum TaxID=1247861 RepID=A0AB34G5P1_9HYPO|nr:PLC-like phosphodiesterase [Purpureocillium lavendulum]
MIASSLRSAVVAALALVAGVQAAPQSTTPGNTTSNAGSKACNNSPELCSRQYNNITHMGAHDSSFLRDASTGNSIAGNQFKNATAALNAGIRLLQAQIHKPNTTLEMCHTSCSLLDAGPLETWLAAVNDWMVANPNEVVTLLLVNSDKAPASDFGAVFEKSGIAKLGYKPQTTSATTNWPTLDTMIGQGTRVVSFITNMDYSASTPYLLPEFDFVFETPFEVTQLTGFNCTVDRPSRANPATTAIGNGWMGLVNHFKYQSLASNIMVPDVDRIDVVNSAATTADGNLGKHVQQCKSEWSKQPNFVLVDFWDKGDPMAAADALNGVSGASGRKTSSNETSTGSAAANGRRLGYGALLAFLSAALLLV